MRSPPYNQYQFHYCSEMTNHFKRGRLRDTLVTSKLFKWWYDFLFLQSIYRLFHSFNFLEFQHQRVESPKSPSSMVVPLGGDICRSLHLFCVPSLKVFAAVFGRKSVRRLNLYPSSFSSRCCGLQPSPRLAFMPPSFSWWAIWKQINPINSHLG